MYSEALVLQVDVNLENTTTKNQSGEILISKTNDPNYRLINSSREVKLSWLIFTKIFLEVESTAIHHDYIASPFSKFDMQSAKPSSVKLRSNVQACICLHGY